MADSKKSQKSASKAPAGGFRAHPQIRHSAERPVPVAPPVLVLLFSALLVVAVGLGLWSYSLQVRQSQIEGRVAEQVAGVLQRMELSGEGQQASFAEIGLSLKTMDDRMRELTQLTVEVQQRQISSQAGELDKLNAELEQLTGRVQQTSAELAALGGLISSRNKEVSGLLSRRLKEAGQLTEQILENQKVSAEQLSTLMAASESLRVYRRTTNQALLRLESRMLLLEKQLEELQQNQAGTGRPFSSGPSR